MTDKLLDHLKRALGEAYTIERELPGAGMSRVFVAREHSLGREVVIKVLPKELAAGVNRERFQQEVQLAARLSHPYIVPLLHAGEHEDLLWFTMPFITGESLKFRLEHEGPVPVREVIQFTHDTLEALAYAHSRGVIHRDIKPANLLVDGGHAVVTDFGVAKALSAAMPTMGTGHTTTGMAIGTPAYMAPEQLAADPAADHRVDIYAIGLLMYELLAGTSPFSANSPTATMTAQLTQMPEPLDRLRKDIPPSLSKLIMRCLAKSADERPATAEEVLKELDLISGELAAAAHGSGERSAVMRRVVPITAALMVVMVIAAAGMIWATKHNTPPTTPLVPPATSEILPASGDSGLGAPLPKSSVAITHVPNHNDSLKICLKFADSAACVRGDHSKSSSATTPATISLPNLDSLVNAALDARMRAMGINMGQRGFDPNARGGQTPPPVRGNTLGPRKVVIAVSNAARFGRVDSALITLTDKAVNDFTRSLGRGNWQVVRRELGRAPEPADTLSNGAYALVTMQLTPNRNTRDSLELLMTVSNPAGGFRYSQKVVPAKGQPNFDDLYGQTSRWVRELAFNPGVSWDTAAANRANRSGTNSLQGGPGGPPGGGNGGRQGRNGGGRPFSGDSGRRGGGPQGGGKDTQNVTGG